MSTQPTLTDQELRRYTKHHHFARLNKRRCSKADFCQTLSPLAPPAEAPALQQRILDTMEAGGRVFAIMKKQEVVGLWFFAYDASYFQEKVNLNPDVSPEELDAYFQVARHLFLQRKGALVPQDFLVQPEQAVLQQAFSKILLAHLKDTLGTEEIGGFVYEGKLYYRGYLKMEKSKNAGAQLVVRTLGFYALGIVFGWQAFDNFALGFVWGFLAALLLSPALRLQEQPIQQVEETAGEPHAPC